MSTLEQYARVRAAIERCGDRDQVLRAEGIAPSAWIALQRRWLDALAAEVEGGGTTLTERYVQAFAQGRPGGPPPIDARASTPVVSPVIAPVIAIAPAPVIAPVIAIAPAPVIAPMPAIPPVIAPPPAPPPAQPRELPAFARGTAMAVDVPRGPVVPFREGAGPSPLATPSPVQAPKVGSGTSMAVEVPRGLVTPFHAGAVPSPPAPPSPAPKVGSETSLAVEVPRHLVMPFAPAPPAPPAPPAKEQAAIPELSVEQYAWVVATLRKAAPADLPQVLARLRLTTDSRRELEERWRARMAADPALQQAFLAALGRHLGRGPG